jgi:hypothetical protein
VKSDISTISTNQTSLPRVAINFSAVAGTSYAIVIDHGASFGAFLTLSIAPVAALALHNINFSSGGPFGFSFSAPPGARYEIEGSNELVNWTTLDGGLVPANGIVSFLDATASNQSARYYRVVLP